MALICIGSSPCAICGEVITEDEYDGDKLECFPAMCAPRGMPFDDWVKVSRLNDACAHRRCIDTWEHKAIVERVLAYLEEEWAREGFDEDDDDDDDEG